MLKDKNLESQVENYFVKYPDEADEAQYLHLELERFMKIDFMDDGDFLTGR